MNICFEKTFSNKHTNMIKGCAAIMLLFHHLFFRYANIQSCFTFCHEEKMILYYTAQMCKVCVALFLVLSGYGLVKSAEKKRETITIEFSLIHITKLLFMFWFIYVLFVPWGIVLGKNPIEIYTSEGNALLNFFADFFGISHLTNTPTMSAVWWYMGEILRLYLFFPILYYGTKTNPLLMLGAGAWMCFSGMSVWVLPFLVGMVAAEKNLFEKYMKQTSKHKFFIVCTGIVIIPLRFLYQTHVDTFFALWIIAVVLWAFCPEKVVGKGLAFIGKHSGNIFMFHSFIYAYYFRAFIYGFKSPYLILSVLLGICLLVSVCIEFLKKTLRYEKLAEKTKQIICVCFSRRKKEKSVT